MPRFFCFALTAALAFGYLCGRLLSPVEMVIITTVAVGTFRFFATQRSKLT